MKKIVILLGIPGSGKGTQAKRLATEFNYQHISTGDLLRAFEKRTDISPRDTELLQEMKQGKLVSDQLIYRLAFEAVDAALASGKGVVLDGAIRTESQARGYQDFFESRGLLHDIVTIEIALSDAEGTTRILGRKICSSCGFIIPYTPHNEALTVCEKCGGALVRRSDDTPETVRERMKEQGNDAVAPVREYYRDHGLLSVVDGTRGIDEVWEEMKTRIV